MGRPKKGHAIRDIFRARPLKDKRALVDVAYEEALQNHDIHWAEFIVKHSGEGATPDDREGLVAELIVRQYAGWPEEME